MKKVVHDGQIGPSGNSTPTSALILAEADNFS